MDKEMIKSHWDKNYAECFKGIKALEIIAVLEKTYYMGMGDALNIFQNMGNQNFSEAAKKEMLNCMRKELDKLLDNNGIPGNDKINWN